MISHSIDGAFAIRQGPWKLCLCGGSGGWSTPRQAEAKQQNLPNMQLFHLDTDPAEEMNLIDQHLGKVSELMELLKNQVTSGRSTPGEKLSNDRVVTWLPE